MSWGLQKHVFHPSKIYILVKVTGHIQNQGLKKGSIKPQMNGTNYEVL